MAKGPRYRVPYRRRRQKKTDYAARRTLATSEYPRFVVRASNRNILVQVTKAEIEGDYVLAYTSSKELKEKYGWAASGKNIPAAYLIGCIAGQKALEAGIERVNLDVGLKKVTYGNKIFAVVKGALDAGLEVPCDSDIIPTPERINASSIAEYAENMEDPIEYESRFSVYLRRGLRPEELNAHFDEVKARIEENKQ
ncbi:MAG: 50S ribosomal protein L18 [Candidatus Bathyarchaeota archaeon]|nr:50S ribosomal protein L18 [Candidatus Bathyarchaeota archaeon]